MIEGMSFQLGHIGRSGRIYVTTSIDEYRQADIVHSGLIILMNGTVEGHDILPAEITAILELQSNDRNVLAALAMDGTLYLRKLNGDIDTLHIDTADGGPSEYRHISTMRLIGDRLYACGMGRIVYASDSRARKWRRIDNNMRIEFGKYEIAGFRDIAGRGDGRLFVCGLAGELWFFDGAKWICEDIPTNVNLTALGISANDQVLVGGSQGTVIAGDHDKWRLLEWADGDSSFRITSIATVGNEVFAATQEGALLSISPNQIQQVDMSSEYFADIQIERVVATGNRALGISQKDISFYENGKWQRVL